MRKVLYPFIFLYAFAASAQNTRLLDQPMKVKNMAVEITADLFTATTFIEMEFYNPNEQEEEGFYRFELSKGQAITNFQLDLNGLYRDGSIEEKWKATNAYNRIVGKRVDPALLQMDYLNHYSLRIYPLPAKGTRKITMTIQQVLQKSGNELQYILPLAIRDTVENVDIRIRVKGAEKVPVSRVGLLYGNWFSRQNQTAELIWKSKNTRPDKPLSFVIPITQFHHVVCTSVKNGKTVFACRIKPQFQESYRLKPSEITVFWDVSANHRTRDLEKEIAFLKKIIERNEVKTVHFFSFNQQLHTENFFDISNGPQAFLNIFYNLKYEGAATFGNIDFSTVNNGSIFIFSNGYNSYGPGEPIHGTRPVFCVNSSDDYNKNFFEKICGTSGGKILDLKNISLPQALAESGIATNKLTRILTKEGTVSIDKESLVFADDEIFITGSMNAKEAELVMEFGTTELLAGVNRVLISQDNNGDSSIVEKTRALIMFDSMNRSTDWYTLLRFGKEERMVTLYTAFIVLEKIEDYIRFNITPPKALEDSCDMSIFVKNDSGRQIINQQLSERELFTAVAKSYNKRRGGTGQEQFNINLDQPVAFEENRMENQPVSDSPLKQAIQTQPVITQKISAEAKTFMSMSEVVVVAMGLTSTPRELGYSVAKVRTHEISGSHPVYLQQALAGKVSGLTVKQVNSGVFADTRITLRGIRSLTGNNEPLLVMDNNPLPLNLISSINPNDIMDVTILKGPAATAIYGPDGVNGALVIRTKKGSRFYSYSINPYKLKNCEDMDYILELKAVSRTEKMSLYEQLKKEFGFEGVFYFEVAQHMFESGLIKEAREILFSGAALTNGNPGTIKAIAYVLESWKMFPEAIEVYAEVLRKDSNNLSSWRDLALACYQDKQVQRCVNLLYNGIRRSWPGMDSLAINMKASMLEEMNALIAVHHQDLDLSSIEPFLIRPVNIDMVITVESNNRTYSRASLLDSKGKNIKDLISYNVILPQEFQLKTAGKSKYKLRINYYGEYSYDQTFGIPSMIKTVVIMHTGQPDQSIRVESVLMNNQSGFVDIGEWDMK